MATITDKLAQALRDLLRDAIATEAGPVETHPANAVLAEYDAQAPQLPDALDNCLNLVDQFLDEWEQDVHDGGGSDADELAERKAQWKEWRPRIEACVANIDKLEDALQGCIDELELHESNAISDRDEDLLARLEAARAAMAAYRASARNTGG